MFGVSFLEIAVVGLIALIVVGPQKLPGMMRTAGEWVGKLRKMTSDMRKQTGIDDILREEGIDGVAELRSLLRGGGIRDMAFGNSAHGTNRPGIQYTENPEPLLEFPVEGVDAAGALPDDLFSEEDSISPEPQEAPQEPSDAVSSDAVSNDAPSPPAESPQLSSPPSGPPRPTPRADHSRNPAQQK